MIEMTLMGFMIVGIFTYMNFQDEINNIFTKEHK
jgi:hypothetical protein